MEHTINELSTIMALSYNVEQQLEGENLLDAKSMIKRSADCLPLEDAIKAQELACKYPELDFHALCHILEMAEFIKRD